MVLGREAGFVDLVLNLLSLLLAEFGAGGHVLSEFAVILHTRLLFEQRAFSASWRDSSAAAFVAARVTLAQNTLAMRSFFCSFDLKAGFFEICLEVSLLVLQTSLFLLEPILGGK